MNLDEELSTVDPVPDGATPQHEYQAGNTNQHLSESYSLRAFVKNTDKNPNHQQLLNTETSHPECSACVVETKLIIYFGVRGGRWRFL